MEKLVLLVDDNRLPMQYYVKALQQKGFTVKQCYKPDSALEFVEERASDFISIILDIMMPPGKIYKDKDTNEGLITGMLLLKTLREKLASIPIIILTNVKNPRMPDEFREDPLVCVMQKKDCPPFELVELVREMLSAVDKKSMDDENGESRERTKRGEDAYES